MLCAAFMALGLVAQQLTGFPGSTALDAVERAADAQREKEIYDAASETQRKLDEQAFIARFNDLVTALRQFSLKYREQHLIDVKNVEAIRKAYRKLEDSDPWFRLKE